MEGNDMFKTIFIWVVLLNYDKYEPENPYQKYIYRLTESDGIHVRIMSCLFIVKKRI
jgi:hypothetical protein